jgi:hypothetical protein
MAYNRYAALLVPFQSVLPMLSLSRAARVMRYRCSRMLVVRLAAIR